MTREDVHVEEECNFLLRVKIAEADVNDCDADVSFQKGPICKLQPAVLCFSCTLFCFCTELLG